LFILLLIFPLLLMIALFVCVVVHGMRNIRW